jgi:hypothetical protein
VIKQPKTAKQALIPFVIGAVAAGAVCALVVSLPEPRRDAVRSSTPSKPPPPPPEPSRSPAPSARPPVGAPTADVRVTVSGRTVRIRNLGPHGTGPIILELRPRRGARLQASCASAGCTWPDLAAGRSIEVRVKGRGGGRAVVRTAAPDRTPHDNAVGLRLPR